MALSVRQSGFLLVLVTQTCAEALPLDCSSFQCTCQGFADWYGTINGETWGCADPAAQEWWTSKKCASSNIKPSVAPRTRRGGCKCITDYSAGLHHQVPCKELWPLGTGISFTYNVPPMCLSKPCGLIVDVHGYTMDSDSQDLNTNMRALGEKNGYIVVQPAAPGWGWHGLPNWNVDAYSHACSALNPVNGSVSKQTCWNAPWNEEPASDRAIHSWLQEALEVSAWKIDRNRVHFMGFSEGGWMTGRMLCNYPDLFASFAMLSGAANDDPFACIQPSSPQVPLLVNQGLNDYSSTWREFDSGLQKLLNKWQLGPGQVIDGKASCAQEWELDCNVFNCTCQGFADWYGAVNGRTWGCATTATAQKWWTAHRCTASVSPGAHRGGCEGCFSRTRYEGRSGIPGSGMPLEVLAYDYVADYADKGHCFPGSDNLVKTGKGPAGRPWRGGGAEFAAFACPGAYERAAGAKFGYKIGDEAMKWFLAHPKKASEIMV